MRVGRFRPVKCSLAWSQLLTSSCVSCRTGGSETPAQKLVTFRLSHMQTFGPRSCHCRMGGQARNTVAAGHRLMVRGDPCRSILEL